MAGTEEHSRSSGSGPKPPRGCIGVYTPRPREPSPDETSADAPRYEASTKDFHLLGYPSAADIGVIALENATTADFQFLGLDPALPPTTRLPNQADEDIFCKSLLRLGARRFKSLERFRQVMAALDNDELILESMRESQEPEAVPRLTADEMRWVIVGWPTAGGFWISDLTRTYELDSRDGSEIGQDHDMYLEAARLRLAGDMDMKCKILETYFKGRYYASWGEYDGSALRKGDLSAF